MHIKILNDLYGIADRLKAIDSGYYILFNIKKQCYEVHNNNQAEGSFCLTVPYTDLDSRTVTLVKSTRREYMENILNEIERNNSRQEDNYFKKQI